MKSNPLGVGWSMRPSTGTAPLCSEVMTTSFFNTLGAVPPPYPLISFTSRGPRAPGEKPCLPACLQRFPIHPSSPLQKKGGKKSLATRRTQPCFVASETARSPDLRSGSVASWWPLKIWKSEGGAGGGGGGGDEGDDKQWQPCIFFFLFFFLILRGVSTAGGAREGGGGCTAGISRRLRLQHHHHHHHHQQQHQMERAAAGWNREAISHL